MQITALNRNASGMALNTEVVINNGIYCDLSVPPENDSNKKLKIEFDHLLAEDVVENGTHWQTQANNWWS